MPILKSKKSNETQKSKKKEPKRFKEEEDCLLDDLKNNPQKYGLKKKLIFIDSFDEKENTNQAIKFMKEIFQKGKIQTLDQMKTIMFFVNQMFYINLNVKNKNENEFEFECAFRLQKEKCYQRKCNFKASYNKHTKQLRVYNSHIIPSYLEFQMNKQIRYNGKLDEIIIELKNSNKQNN